MDSNIKRFIEEAERYTSWDGRTCYRTFADLEWYFKKCKEFGVQPKCVDDFSWEAENDEIELSYCEGDVTLYVKKEETCKYYVEISDANGEYVIQSQWVDTQEEAIDWAHDLAFVRDDHIVALIRANWDEGCDTYGDIEFVNILEV